MVGTLVDMASERKQPDTDNARISKAIMRKVRIVAARRNMSTPEYLNSLLAGPVDTDYAAEVAAMAKESAAERRRKPD